MSVSIEIDQKEETSLVPILVPASKEDPTNATMTEEEDEDEELESLEHRDDPDGDPLLEEERKDRGFEKTISVEEIKEETPDDEKTISVEEIKEETPDDND